MAQIVDHAHCEICQRVVETGKRWCSEECEEKHDEAQGEKKKAAIRLVIVAALLLIVFQFLPQFI